MITINGQPQRPAGTSRTLSGCTQSCTWLRLMQSANGWRNKNTGEHEQNTKHPNTHTMCCCGNEHNADPPYKTSRSAACCTLSTEIILLVMNVVLWIAVAIAAILVCAVAAATQPEGYTATATPTTMYLKIYSGTCATTTGYYAQSYTYHAITTKADCETGAKYKLSSGSTSTCSDTTADEVATTTDPKGCICDSSNLEFNTGSSQVAASYTKPLICRLEPKTTRRLLRESSNELHKSTAVTTHAPWFATYAKHLIPAYDSKFTNKEYLLSIFHKQHAGRRLDACDDDENCAKLKKAGLEGCSNATTILSMFWPNNLFALLGVIFYSMIACNCCKGCCGGFQQKNKMVMVYSIIAAIWGLVQTILHAMLNGALTAVKEVCIATNQSSGLVAVIDGLATTILICTLFHALCTVLRLVSAFFMFKAQQVPHNGDAGANGGVQAVVVPVGQVVVVQPPK